MFYHSKQNYVKYYDIAHPGKDKDFRKLQEAVNYLKRLGLIIVKTISPAGDIFKLSSFYEASEHGSLEKWMEYKSEEAEKDREVKETEQGYYKSAVELNEETKANNIEIERAISRSISLVFGTIPI